MKDCIFSFYISKAEAQIEELPEKHEFGEYIVYTDKRTPFNAFDTQNRMCAVFGYAIDLIDNVRDGVARHILTNSNSLRDVIACEAKLGGKYLLLYKDDSGYYMLGDATCSIPIFYNIDNDFICSNNYQRILNAKKYSLDCEYKKIRESSDISQAMPYDITQYRQIKQLIPNHYLYIDNKKPVRFINSPKKQDTITIEKATEIVLPMIEKMVEYYSNLHKVYCPLTSGRDSRVVLASLMHMKKSVKCYTIRHPEHSDSAQDIVIPRILCENGGVPYQLIEDIVVSEEMKAEADSMFGENYYPQRTLRISQTVKKYYSDGAILTGDIIGQVGKCSLHRDIPSIFATPAYFRCKLHNYSSGAKKQLRRWLREIKASGEGVNTFDLFSVENRMGRWAGQTNLVYDTAGQLYLNIFNSRSIIYTWTAVKRSLRKKALLHIDLIQQMCAELLSVPFECDESAIIRITKLNGIFYCLSSYIKYHIEKQRFNRQKRK